MVDPFLVADKSTSLSFSVISDLKLNPSLLTDLCVSLSNIIKISPSKSVSLK
jgi:hypothetical protein